MENGIQKCSTVLAAVSLILMPLAIIYPNWRIGHNHFIWKKKRSPSTNYNTKCSRYHITSVFNYSCFHSHSYSFWLKSIKPMNREIKDEEIVVLITKYLRVCFVLMYLFLGSWLCQDTKNTSKRNNSIEHWLLWSINAF